MRKGKHSNLSKSELIAALKKRFPGNNPASWSRNSLKQLDEWYKEYIMDGQ
jgi:hypothetical protein